MHFLHLQHNRIAMSAYLLPYFVNDRNQTKVQCAQKQVLSYEAIGNWESRKSGDWQTLAGKIATDGNILLADGKSEGISGTRLQGMLLPAGGKMAFFGGGFEKSWLKFVICKYVLYLFYYL